MLTIAAVRRAIEDVERAVASSAAPLGIGEALAARSTLGRLYSVYAQGVLELHGISVDLDDLCTQCCRQCPVDRCVRDEAAG
jgi:hypothetical protein